MPLILIGVLLIIGGVVLATTKQIREGRMSQAREPVTGAPRDTLEPAGQGRRLTFKADLPGLALIAIGVVLLFAGAA